MLSSSSRNSPPITSSSNPAKRDRTASFQGDDPASKQTRLSSSDANRESLPFVNRFAEVFDVIAVNLEGFDLPTSENKPFIPVASQIMGTGKTFLGRHVIKALNRPRLSHEEEKKIAQRLLLSRKLCDIGARERHAIIEQALASEAEESLVVRALRSYLKLSSNSPEIDAAYDEYIDQVKGAHTVFVNCQSLEYYRRYPTLNEAIAALICEKENLDLDPQLMESTAQVCKHLVDTLKTPIFVVLDEIGTLQDSEYAKWWSKQGVDEAEQAMRALSGVLRKMMLTPRVLVYCTGRTDYVALHTLCGPTSPLRPFPIMLHPLQGRDILDIVREYREGRSQNCSIRIERIAPSFDESDWAEFAEELSACAGGNGRIIEEALSVLSKDSSLSIASVGQTLKALFSTLSRRRHLFQKDLRSANAIAPSLLRIVGRHLLHDIPFEPQFTVPVGENRNMDFRDALSILGFSFTPCEDSSMLRATAGRWQLALLSSDLLATPDAVEIQLFEQLMRSSDTQRGAPFELICINGMVTRWNLRISPSDSSSSSSSSSSENVLLGDLFPHLSHPPLQDVRIAQRLRSVLIPKITSSVKPLEGSKFDIKRKTLHPDDLWWLLSEWLADYSVAIPGSQSGSQDWFLKVPRHLMAVANKMHLSAGLTMGHIKDEVTKAPKGCSEELSVTLVVYAAKLGEELRQQVGESHSTVVVVDGMNVIVVSPSHKDGLRSVVGPVAMSHLDILHNNPIDSTLLATVIKNLNA